MVNSFRSDSGTEYSFQREVEDVDRGTFHDHTLSSNMIPTSSLRRTVQLSSQEAHSDRLKIHYLQQEIGGLWGDWNIEWGLRGKSYGPGWHMSFSDAAKWMIMEYSETRPFDDLARASYFAEALERPIWKL